MSEHTPGPWSVDRAWLSRVPISAPHTDGLRWLIAETAGGSPTDVANARLIAAAPEMLEALCLAQAVIDPENDPPQILNREALAKICAAIRKATAHDETGHP